MSIITEYKMISRDTRTDESAKAVLLQRNLFFSLFSKGADSTTAFIPLVKVLQSSIIMKKL